MRPGCRGRPFTIAFIYPAGMGMGDVKLAFLMGAALGRSVLPALMLAMVLAVIPAIGLLIRHGRAGRTWASPSARSSRSARSSCSSLARRSSHPFG